MDANIQEDTQSQVHSTVSASQDQLLNSMTTLLDTRLDSRDIQISKQNALMNNTTTTRKCFSQMREVNAEIEGSNLSLANINNAKKKDYRRYGFDQKPTKPHETGRFV